MYVHAVVPKPRNWKFPMQLWLHASISDTVPPACLEQPRYLENMPHDRHVGTESPMAHSY